MTDTTTTAPAVRLSPANQRALNLTRSAGAYSRRAPQARLLEAMHLFREWRNAGRTTPITLSEAHFLSEGLIGRADDVKARIPLSSLALLTVQRRENERKAGHIAEGVERAEQAARAAR